MSDKPNILFVDDEENILNSHKRNLRKEYNVHIDSSPHHALELLKSGDIMFPVVVSDYRMPDMNGVDFLSQVKTIQPDASRILLTGQADFQATIDAINKGQIYRFISKPCEKETLVTIINQGIEQYQLVTAEKSLLEETLFGSVDMMVDLFTLIAPQKVSQIGRVNTYCEAVYSYFDMMMPWYVKLCNEFIILNQVTLSEDLTVKLDMDAELDNDDVTMLNESNHVLETMLSKIPRLDKVVEAICATRDKTLDASILKSKFPDLAPMTAAVQIIRASFEFDRKCYLQQLDRNKALRTLFEEEATFHPELKSPFKIIDIFKKDAVIEEKSLAELNLTMTFAEDVLDQKGVLLIVKGQKVTEATKFSLKNLIKLDRLKDGFKVYV